MHRLFVRPEQIDLDTATVCITDQDHVHLSRVLRARVGEFIELLDGAGNGYSATISEIRKRETVAKIASRFEPLPEPPIHITVAQAIVRASKFEEVLQHGTEAGVSRFIPIEAGRSGVDIPERRLTERTDRWRSIVKGAAEQSRRSRIPVVAPPTSLKELLDGVKSSQTASLLLHTGPASVPLKAIVKCLIPAPPSLILLVGPEGGWSSTEIELAVTHGCLSVSLGQYVLRTETAALVAVSQVLFHFASLEESA